MLISDIQGFSRARNLPLCSFYAISVSELLLINTTPAAQLAVEWSNVAKTNAAGYKANGNQYSTPAALKLFKLAAQKSSICILKSLYYGSIK